MQLYTSQNYLPHWNNLVLVAYYTNYIIDMIVLYYWRREAGREGGGMEIIAGQEWQGVRK